MTAPLRRRLLASVALLGVIGPIAALAAPASAAPATGPIAINEVEVAADWIELVNTGSAPVDISGYQLRDDKDTASFLIPAGTVLAPGGRYTADVNLDTNVGAGKFGLGKADQARLFAADLTTPLDSFTWTQDPGTSWSRCADGTGDFVVAAATSRGAVNVCAADPSDAVVINEIESNGGTPGDWIELKNIATTPVDVSGLRIKDSADSGTFAIPAATRIAAGGYLVLEQADLGFGLGDTDTARLFESDGATLIDDYAWTAHATTSYGRCADGVGDFTTTASVTKAAANDCAPPPAAGAVVINEVESNGDDTDWVELVNVSSAPVDISGFRFRDNDDARAPFVVPSGSVVAPGAFFVLDGASATKPGGFTFGLGEADSARLFAADGATTVASYAWKTHAAVTWGRCPDGTGDFADTTVSTKGAPNDCSIPLAINEVESDAGPAADWVELKNVGTAAVDASGFILRDSADTSSFRIPSGSVVQPGAYLVLDRGDGATGFDFGLGTADAARLFEKDGTTSVDEYSWTAHAATTYGRCPDGTGDFVGTTAPSRGAINECAGIINPAVWPGAQTVAALDAADTFGKDLSGLDWESSGTGAPGTLWAVQNGAGLLYRIESDGRGGWAPRAADGWAAGKTLAYPRGEAGVVDAEGVTVAGDDSSGGVYVSTERNNAASGVSRPSVLRVDVSESDTTLAAQQEWNLARDFPGLGANAGLEGITWVPDAFLVEKRFVDRTTGRAYSPASYPAHTGGLFFIGVEGTASVYAYALFDDGSFQRIATIDAKPQIGFGLVADVQFDADRGALWVVCDEVCDGEIAAFQVDAAGAFAPTALYARPAETKNYANEGFAVADDSQCVAGVKPTFYADDADTDGNALRTGTIRCIEREGTDPTTPGGDTDPGTSPTTGGRPVPTGTSKGTALASTGADPAPGLIGAALLLLVGSAGVLVARRRPVS